jgi:hypothetical protein
MSIDEFISIHEQTTMPLVKTFGFKGYLYDAWVLIWGPIALIIFLSYIGFLKHLPSTVRWLAIFGGLIFIGGAIGIEMVSANYEYAHGMNNITYESMEQIEELMEMIGISVFISALLLHMKNKIVDIEISVR